MLSGDPHLPQPLCHCLDHCPCCFSGTTRTS
uniref:Uncharacterized protein n=1 Tax=Homo sapiens TaxID=9606 RepID=Q9P2Z8_HUMAN|nr:unknown [Homo sapiens]